MQYNVGLIIRHNYTGLIGYWGYWMLRCAEIKELKPLYGRKLTNDVKI